MFAVLNINNTRECSDGSLHSINGMRVIFLPVAVNVEYNTVSVYPRVERQCAHSILWIVFSSGTGIDTFFINVCFMLNKSRNLQSTAVISGSLATGGSDMATIPTTPAWPSLGSVADALQLRAGHLKASALSILRSEGFSIAVGFVMSFLMMFLLWFTCSIFY